MKKIFVSVILVLFCSTMVFASEFEGKWTTTIETDNGPFTFYADYVVKGEIITGSLSSDMGSVEISNGKIVGDEIEYTFEIDYTTMKHKGKLVDGKLEIKSSGGDYGEFEFTMTRVKKE
jgi:hypothetical protein